MSPTLLWSPGCRVRAAQVLASLLLALLAWTGIAAAAVTARFDRDQVHEGETVTLTIESDGLGGGNPDLSPLDADFDVLGTSSGSRIQIVNGRQSATRSWQVTLTPKRLGTIEVPPIAVGTDETRSLVLSVREMPQAATGSPGDDLFLELSVGSGDGPVYVQQQVPVTVRLYSALPLRGGELSEPRADGAVLERLGEDVQYEANRNGRDYQVIERHFSLSPERSGELRIPSVSFSGELRSASGGSPFGNDRLAQLFRDPVFDRLGSSLFERGEPVRARSRALTLEVLPQPDGFTGRSWLPASALAIDDSWAHEPPQLTGGEPAERVLTVTATGLAGSQIPEIEVRAPANVRVYPEGTETETRTDGKQLFGVSRQRVSVIPTAGGVLDFPEIRLRWWDVAAGKERVALVPARALVAAGPVDTPAVPPVPSSAPDQAQRAAENGRADTGSAVQPARLHATRRPAFWVLMAGLAAVAGLFLWRGRARILSRLGVWRRGIAQRTDRRVARADDVRPPGGRALPERGADALKNLQTACGRQDARAAAAALLALARQRLGPGAPGSLGGVAARFADLGKPAGQRAAAAVRGLEATLYGPSAADWNAAEVAESVPAALAAMHADARPVGAYAEPLAPLYPQRH